MTRFALFLALSAPAFSQPDYTGWRTFGGTPDNIHYSALKQINRTNVKNLKTAWTWESGDSYKGSGIQCNPIMVGGVLYATTPKLRVVALHAGTGKLIWSYNGLGDARPNHPNRGLTYWSDGKQARILITLGHHLLSINARTGKLDPAFGQEGKVDMREAFDRPVEDVQLSVTTPGTIYKDLIILGSSVPEQLPSTPGDIRAYDVRTGKLRWVFHTIPRPGEPGYETWPKDAWKHTGGANNWAGLTVDQQRGLAFVPTGSAAYDFNGTDRPGDNLYANSLICLDAATGKYKWHYQTIRHDVWDLDFPSAPLLVTVRREGKLVDAVAQAGKDGFVYVFNRETGESLFPMEERDVPPSPIAGEILARKQRFPLKPAPFSRQVFTEDMITKRTPEVHRTMLEKLKTLDYGDRFTPPSVKGTIVMPGFSGGAEWGGQAYDPETHLFYVNANEMPWLMEMVPPEKLQRRSKASEIYRSRCASCHRLDRKGAPPEFPGLLTLANRMQSPQLADIIRKGSGRMPGFASLGEPAINALVEFLYDKGDPEAVIASREKKSPVQFNYVMNGYQKFLDPDGYPAITPPWGTLSAINLDTGEYAWKVPLGEHPELVKKGMKNTGTENHGGGIVTAGGLFFIAGTPEDRKLRAFDKLTGKLLWETTLTHGGNATPAMYEYKGKQYLVIAAGGGRGGPSGGSYVAFALPENPAKR